jgi:hypothetical protein
MAEQSSYTVDQHAANLRNLTHRVVYNPTHIPQTQDGTVPSHQMEMIPRSQVEAVGSGSERWPNRGWPESGDGTNYPGLPNQAQTAAVVAQAQAERDQRTVEAAEAQEEIDSTDAARQREEALKPE